MTVNPTPKTIWGFRTQIRDGEIPRISACPGEAYCIDYWTAALMDRLETKHLYMWLSRISYKPSPAPQIRYALSSLPCAALMLASTKISPLRHLANIISDAVARIDEKYASANLEFPTLDKPFNAKDPACILMSDPDVVPLSCRIV